MRFSETHKDVLTTKDGLELDIHIWEPDSTQAILLAVHGGLAHAGDYVTPALFFKEKEITTVAYDLRGQKRKKYVLIHLNNSLMTRMCLLNGLKPGTRIFRFFIWGIQSAP